MLLLNNSLVTSYIFCKKLSAERAQVWEAALRIPCLDWSSAETSDAVQTFSSIAVWVFLLACKLTSD